MGLSPVVMLSLHNILMEATGVINEFYQRLWILAIPKDNVCTDQVPNEVSSIVFRERARVQLMSSLHD